MNRILLQRVTGDASRDCLHFERITLLPLPYQLKEFHTDKPKIIKTKEAFDKTIYIEEEIAFAQSYFAVQTRKQELIEEHIAYIERTQARTRLRESEKRLSQNIYERGVDEKGFGRIRSKGDQALFGGRSTQEMKKILLPSNMYKITLLSAQCLEKEA